MEKLVTVLRDTGCSGIVIRMSTVEEESFINGKKQVCVSADGLKVSIPIAGIYIDSPYLKGRHEAWCTENQVYELIVGNVPCVKPPVEIDRNWQSNAVVTRKQR